MKDRRISEAEDEELVRRYQSDPAGEAGRTAASELFERYWERVYLWCYRRIGRHEAACDAAQDVLLSAYESLRSFQGRCRYRSWLFTIMRNRCFRVLRRRSLIRDEEVEVDRIRDSGTSVDALLIELEDEEEILELIRKTLDPVEQTAIWLRSFERLPIDEITRRLNIGGASGARGVLQTARRKLHAALVKRAGLGEGDA
jgi:RNA polymerase sigma-70 factor, ECF subfamily